MYQITLRPSEKEIYRVTVLVNRVLYKLCIIKYINITLNINMEIAVTSNKYLSCVNCKLLKKTCKLFKEQLNGCAIPLKGGGRKTTMILIDLLDEFSTNFYTGFHFQLQRLFEQNTNSSTPITFSEELERVPATRQLIYGN